MGCDGNLDRDGRVLDHQVSFRPRRFLFALPARKIQLLSANFLGGGCRRLRRL